MKLKSRHVLRLITSALTALLLIMTLISGCQKDDVTETETSDQSQPAGDDTAEPSSESDTLIIDPDETEATAEPQTDTVEARNSYPPEITRDVLTGIIPVPKEVNDCLVDTLGEARFNELRSGGDPSGTENDIAAECLFKYKVSIDPRSGSSPPSGEQTPGTMNETIVSRTDSSYRVAPGNLSGWFSNAQEADIMLSGIDFNNSGGPLLFNHPKGIATDGTHLLVADGNNNRVLIWNTLPDGNTEPDLVLGQNDFIANNPGTGPGQMNWPAAVDTDGTRIVVADTYNDRILIWNEYPSVNGAPADIILDGKAGFSFNGQSKTGFGWPWGIWTNGEKLAVTSTAGSYVLIWNTFPTEDDQPADILLTAGGDMGTPRTITSNGESLIVGDHNARNTASMSGNFFWSTFPTTDDEPYDFFSPDPLDSHSAWMQGDFTDDGKLVMLGSTVHIWDEFPSDANDTPDVSITGFRFTGGDGADIAIAGTRVYISMYNGNRIVVYNDIPTSPEQKPDFAIGSPDINTNTLDTHYIITNGVPITDGTSLFVSSDFDRKLYVWKQFPDESGAYPDLVYSLPMAPWDNAIFDDTLVLAGKTEVLVWNTLPTDGQLPDKSYSGSIGGIDFKELNGVALDETYFYLSDFGANMLYVWEGIPDEETPPLFSIPIDQPWRLCSDGEYLAVTSIYHHSVYLYRIADLASSAVPAATVGGPGQFNLPQNSLLSHGSLFIADTGFNQIHIWRTVTDAMNGDSADVVLGQGGQDIAPLQIKDGLFWPVGLAFDGDYLWAGEFKFGNRLLRFSIQD